MVSARLWTPAGFAAQKAIARTDRMSFAATVALRSMCLRSGIRADAIPSACHRIPRAALALGMAVATAALSVSLDVGDRLAKEFRSLGANLLVTPQADSLPLEIGGVDYRPVNTGAYLPEADLPKLKTIFWHNNIMGFSPILEVRVSSSP